MKEHDNRGLWIYHHPALP